MDATHQVADLPEGRLRLLVGLGDERLAALGVGLQALAGGAEVHGQGHEALLGAVVEVPLDAAPLGFGRVDRGHPPGLGLDQLGGQRRVGPGPEQPAPDADLDPTGDRPSATAPRRRARRRRPARRGTSPPGRPRRTRSPPGPGAGPTRRGAAAARAADAAPRASRRSRTRRRRPGSAAGCSPPPATGAGTGPRP